MPAKTTKPKRFPLVINHPNEDRPRLFTAKGRACGGQFLFAMRTVTGGPAHEAPSSERPTEPTGEVHTALLFIPKKPRRARGEKTAPPHVAQISIRWAGAGVQGPGKPREEIDPRAGERLLRSVAQRVGRQGPKAMKGSWRGWLICDNGTPSVHLERKLGSYVKLTMVSNATHGHWNWTLERSEKWFGANANTSGRADSFLIALDEAYTSVARLVGPACSVRDTQRRQAHDADYAAAQPARFRKQQQPATRTFRESGVGTWTRLTAAEARRFSGGKLTDIGGKTTETVERQLRALPTRATAGATQTRVQLLNCQVRAADGTVLYKPATLVMTVYQGGGRKVLWVSSKRFVRLMKKMTDSVIARLHGGKTDWSKKNAATKKPTAKKAATKKPAAKESTPKKPAAKKSTPKKPAAKKAARPRKAQGAGASRVDAKKSAALAQAVAQGAQQGMFALFGNP